VALAETAKLVVDLSLKGNFARQVGTANRALSKLDKGLDRTESRAYRAGQQIGTGIKRIGAGIAIGAGIVALNVQQGLDSLVELEQQMAQTNAVIKSTGGAAGITADQVRSLAEEFESLNATIGDEVIQSAENLLLGFTNINKKAFKPALQAVLDINTRLGKGPGGLAGTAQLVGRALQDPVKGIGRLERAIGPLNAKTKTRIKNLVKENRLYDAQALILAEVEKRFGGAFAAEGGTTGAKVKKFKDAIEDLQRTLAAGLLPVVSNIADALSDLFRDPQVQRGVAEFGQNLAKVLSPANIKSGIGAIKDVLSTIAAVAGPAATAVGLLVSAFSKIPPDLRNILIGAFAVNKLTGGLITNIAGAFKDMVVGSMNVQAANVTVVGGGGVPGVGGGGGGIGGLIKTGLALTVAGAIVAAAVPIGKAFASALPDSFKGRPGETGMNDPERLLKIARALNPPTQVLGPGVQQHLHEEHIRRGDSAIKKSIDDSKKRLADQIAETKRETTRGVTATNATKGAVNATKSAVQVGDNHVAATVSSSVAASTGAIVGAIFAARPVVNVTAITKTTTVNNRYGNGNGSQGTESYDAVRHG